MKYFSASNHVSNKKGRRLFIAAASWIATLLMGVVPMETVSAQTFGVNQSTETTPVVVSGVVPDEATKAKLIGKVRELYGDRVVDQLSIGSVIAPPNWSVHVQKILNNQLRSVKNGQLQVDGNVVRIRGQVSNEALRQQLVSQLATNLTSSYSIKDGLTVHSTDQVSLDQTLGNRIIEFDSGSSNLREGSKLILREIAASINKLGGKVVEIVGHTDNAGNPNNNLILSRARAESVRQYLASNGIAPSQMTTTGLGASQPIASNDEDDGRRRNRRIEFRITN